jgi:hypothetical protein
MGDGWCDYHHTLVRGAAAILVPARGMPDGHGGHAAPIAPPRDTALLTDLFYLPTDPR